MCSHMHISVCTQTCVCKYKHVNVRPCIHAPAEPGVFLPSHAQVRMRTHMNVRAHKSMCGHTRSCKRIQTVSAALPCANVWFRICIHVFAQVNYDHPKCACTCEAICMLMATQTLKQYVYACTIACSPTPCLCLHKHVCAHAYTCVCLQVRACVHPNACARPNTKRYKKHV